MNNFPITSINFPPLINPLTTFSIPAIVPGLEGWWHFDEGTGTTSLDSSGKNRNVTLNNVSWGAGINRSALVFPDRSISRNAKSSVIDARIWAQLSVSWWCNQTAPAGVGNPRVWSFGVTTTDGIQVYCLNGTNTMEILESRTGGDSSNDIANAFDTKLRHYVFTWDNALRQWALYRDGALLSGGPKGAFITMPNRALTIGNLDTPTTQGTWIGIVDEVQIYSTVLTSAQVYNLYLFGTPDPGVSNVTAPNILFEPLKFIFNQPINQPSSNISSPVVAQPPYIQPLDQGINTYRIPTLFSPFSFVFQQPIYFGYSPAQPVYIQSQDQGITATRIPTSFSPLEFIFQQPIYYGYSPAASTHIPTNVQRTLSDISSYFSYPRRQENFARKIQYVAPPAGLSIIERDTEGSTDIVTTLKTSPPNLVYIVIQDTEAYKG